MSNRKLALILLFLFSMLCPMFIYSSVIYTEQNTNIFNPDIAVALGSGNAGTSIIGLNGTSATANVTANWWTSWNYRKQITIDKTKVSGSLTNFPVLISLSSDASLASHARSDGWDIVFTLLNGTKLSHEIETYNSTSGQLVAWVRVPAVSNISDTILYMYYGNLGSGNQQSPESVWQSDYKAAWHLNETSGSSINDSTTNNNDGVPQNGVALDAVGKIDGADSFDGNDDWTNLGTSSSLNFGANAPFTIEGWFKVTESYGPILSFRNSANEGAVIDVCIGYDGAINSAGSLMGLVRQDSDSSGYARITGTAVNDGNWHFFVLTRNAGSTIQLFSDGVSKGTNSGSGSGGAITTNLRALGSERRWIQDSYGTADQRYLNGAIDEVRISNVERSVAWIVTEYNNQNSPNTFHTLGSEEKIKLGRDYVDSISNVDSSPDIGTHSNFTKQQYGPDAINDTLTETNLGGVASYNPSATTSGTYPWTNPSNAYSSNNQYATAVARIPTYRSTGAMAHNTTSAITPALPASMVANDIVILVACCYTDGTIAITEAGSITTWNALTGTPVDVTAGDKLYVWWGRYSSGSTGPTLTPTNGDHIVGRTVAFYNCYAGGSPIDVSATGSETTSDTSFSFATGLTTTYNNEVCVCICTTTYDPTSDNTTAFGTMTNGNLAGINERMDNDVDEGNGGGFGLDHGTRVANGAMGTWASTLVGSTPKSYIAFALRSNVPDNDFDQIYGTFGVTGSYAITKVEIGYEAYSSVAQQLDIYTSSNGGSSWNTIHTTANLGTSDPNSYTYVDVTADTSWTWTLLNNANFKVKVVSHWLSGTPTWSIDTLIVRVTQVSYSLELEEQFTAVDYNVTYEELCVATGPLSAESLAVQVWNGSWNTVIAALTANAWNNVSVSSFVSSTELYIRFVGTSESSDTTQSTWEIDATLLNVKTDTYDYILSAASKKAYAQNITLTLYSYSNINRLSNCTVWFHDGLQSVQIAIINGVVTQTSGTNYALPAGSSRYIAAYVQQSSPGTSTLSIRLEAKTQNTIVYACLIDLWVT